jgi:hypothetical protein
MHIAGGPDQTDGTERPSSWARIASGFAPGKRFGTGIVLEISVDVGPQVGDRAEDAADALAGHFGKEVLDRIEPGGGGRGEVENPARMAPQPASHKRALGLSQPTITRRATCHCHRVIDLARVVSSASPEPMRFRPSHGNDAILTLTGIVLTNALVETDPPLRIPLQ